MNYLLSLILIVFTCNAWAEEIFPARCTPLVVDGDRVILPAAKSMVTMVHNLSSADLWITHPVSEPNTSAGWSSHLQAGNWSALIVNDQKFELSCIESKPGHEQQVPCATVLAVCQWTATSLPQHAADTVWAGEDMLLSPLTAYMKRRGFVIGTPAKTAE